MLWWTHQNFTKCVCPHLATQIDSGATVGSLFVQSIARSDEVTDISNMDPYLQQITKRLIWNLSSNNLHIVHSCSSSVVCTCAVPRGFHFPALCSAGHHLCLYILEDPHYTLSDVWCPVCSPCPEPHIHINNINNTQICDRFVTQILCSVVQQMQVTSGVMAHGILGRKLSTAWEKAWWGTSCSSSSTSCSVSLSPALPRLRTKWP